MNPIREEVCMFMENSPFFSKFKGKKWYQIEDELTSLLCNITGCIDTTYEQSEEPVDKLAKSLKEKEPSKFEEKIYRKVSEYYRYKDLQTTLEDNEECYDEKEIAKIRENANRIVQVYDDNLDYDWRTALEEAIDYVIHQEDLCHQ